MQIIERHVKKVRPDKWAKIEQKEKAFDAVEAKHGFPPKRHYRLLAGADDNNTLVMERQWEIFAAMEAAYEKAMADPEWQALDVSDLYKGRHIEIALPWP